MAYWLESRTHNLKVAGSSLGQAGIVGGGEWIYTALSTFNTTTGVPLSKAPHLLSGRCSNMAAHCSGCVHCCVYALWMG